MSDELTYERKYFTTPQWQWCRDYLLETGFEPMMCDFVANTQSFAEAARLSIAWFESWSSDAYLRITAMKLPPNRRAKSASRPTLDHAGEEGEKP